MNTLVDNKEGLKVVRLTATHEIERLLHTFAQVATEFGWSPGDLLRHYPDAAYYIAAQTETEIAGGFQVVLPDAQGYLPFHTVWPDVSLEEPARVAHVTVLALRQEYRGRFRLFWSLCAECWRFLVEQEIDAVVLEATPPMLVRYRRLGWPLEVVGELRLHWGEECYLCRLDMRTAAGAMLMRSLRSPIYRPLVEQAIRPVARLSCSSAPTLP